MPAIRAIMPRIVALIAMMPSKFSPVSIRKIDNSNVDKLIV